MHSPRVAVAVALSTLVASWMPAPGSGGVHVTNPEAIEGPLVTAINQARVARGLRTLRVSAELARAGDGHAGALAAAGVFTHGWPDGRRFANWMQGYYPLDGARVWSAGENLIWTSGKLTPSDAVRRWLASPEHSRVLLDPGWVEIGTGVVHATDAAGAFGGRTVDIGAAEFGRRTP